MERSDALVNLNPGDLIVGYDELFQSYGGTYIGTMGDTAVIVDAYLYPDGTLQDDPKFLEMRTVSVVSRTGRYKYDE